MTNNQEYYQELFNSIDPEIENLVGQFVDACEEIRKTQKCSLGSVGQKQQFICALSSVG